LLAPALLERTSSLAKRILAMQPERARFPRVRGALGAAAACVIVAVACEMPTPEMLAPDGKNAEQTRLYGELEKRYAGRAMDPRELVARYFPTIARGEGEPAILFVVKSASGDIVLVDHQPAAFARVPRERPAVTDSTLRRESALLRADGGAQPREPARSVGGLRLRRAGATSGAYKRQASAAMGVPTALGAVDPNDIATIDVSKHAAGTVAPKPVSIITIVLKPGARVPERAARP
jgi:hypothetical protein